LTEFDITHPFNAPLPGPSMRRGANNKYST
jgi:hypothetical protein